MHCLDALSWFPDLHRRFKAKLRLFCFPYAGSGVAVFHNWAIHFPESIAVCPIQLPGRGARFLEPPIEQFPFLVKTIIDVIKPYLGTPFVFFGHSLGSLFAFEIAHQLRLEHLPSPVHFIASGCAAPSMIKQRALSKLSDQELINELRLLNGTSNEILENEEFMALALPGLRADFALYESYNYKPRKPLEYPFTVFGGTEDHGIDREQLESWSQETRNLFSLHQLPGDHFFLHSEEGMLLKLIMQELDPLINKIA